jgi:regulatory protein
VVVEIDGLRFATLPADVAAALEIRERMELSAEALERLAETANVEAAHRVALRLLATRPRARGDLIRRLRERGHDPAAASEAVARLEGSGLVDDAVFARHFARVRAGRGHGPARIRSDLKALGVEDPTWRPLRASIR